MVRDLQKMEEIYMQILQLYWQILQLGATSMSTNHSEG